MPTQILSRFTGALLALALLLQAGLASAGEDSPAAFREVCAKKASGAGDSMVIAGADGWLFLGNELRHLGVGRFWGEAAAAVSRATKAQDADPLPAILDFKRQLDALGIELLLVPVPAKAIIFPDKVASTVAKPVDGKAPARLDAIHQEFYTLLREKGVNVLDLTDDFLANRLAEDGPVYCRQDTHWSGLACNLAAQRIAEVIRQKNWYAGLTRTKFGQRAVSVPITGDLWSALAEGSRPERDTLKLRMINVPGGGPVAPDRNSPVILLGDSHNLVFQAGGDMHAAGAGLADHLAYELGFAVDLIGVRGSGATPARINLYRRGIAEPGYFGKKKIVVWCFTAREFTESQGWRLVPVSK